MKKIKMKRWMIAVCLLFLSLSCKKLDPIRYAEKDGLAFYIRMQSQTDSTSYSFANQLGQLTQDTIWVKMRITGQARNYARKVELKPVDSLTTALVGHDYSLPSYTLPADSFSFVYPVVLLNSEKLKVSSLVLGLEVKENDDFIQGAVGIADVSTKNTRYFKIRYNNQMIKPDYWMFIQPYFGDYSAVKYKFMIEVLKTADFTPESLPGGTISSGDFLNYKSKMRKALDMLNKQNGYKLLDEFGQEVTF